VGHIHIYSLLSSLHLLVFPQGFLLPMCSGIHPIVRVSSLLYWISPWPAQHIGCDRLKNKAQICFRSVRSIHPSTQLIVNRHISEAYCSTCKKLESSLLFCTSRPILNIIYTNNRYFHFRNHFIIYF
jgi:hypothetical protein